MKQITERRIKIAAGFRGFRGDDLETLMRRVRTAAMVAGKKHKGDDDRETRTDEAAWMKYGEEIRKEQGDGLERIRRSGGDTWFLGNGETCEGKQPEDSGSWPRKRTSSRVR